MKFMANVPLPLVAGRIGRWFNAVKMDAKS
jgi:hypothetical protein